MCLNPKESSHDSESLCIIILVQINPSQKPKTIILQEKNLGRIFNINIEYLTAVSPVFALWKINVWEKNVFML